MSRVAILTLLLAANASAVLAQVPLTARSFPPKDFKAEIFVDIGELVDTGIYGSLSRSVLGVSFTLLEQELALDIEDIDTMRMHMEIWHREEHPEHWRQGGVCVLTGSEDLVLPEPPGYRLEEFGGYDAAIEDNRWAGEDPDLWLQVKPGLVVYGTQHLLQPVVDGRAQPGLPSGDFLSLTSGKNGLAHLVLAVEDWMWSKPPLSAFESYAEEIIDPTDPPEFLAVRLLTQPAAEEDDYAQIRLEAIVRHRLGTKGPEALLAAAREGLEQAQQHPRLAALRHLWSKVEMTVDGRDVRLVLPLGNQRDAGGTLAMMMAPALLFSVAQAEAQVQVMLAQPGIPAVPVLLELEAIEEPPPPPPAAPVKPASVNQARPVENATDKPKAGEKAKPKAGEKAKDKPKAGQKGKAKPKVGEKGKGKPKAGGKPKGGGKPKAGGKVERR